MSCHLPPQSNGVMPGLCFWKRVSIRLPPMCKSDHLYPELFYTESIKGSFPPPPDLPDAVVTTIVDEKRSETIVNNQRYHVLEKRYAIFPQKSGILTIPLEVFRGTRGGSGFFSQRQQVSALTEDLNIL